MLGEFRVAVPPLRERKDDILYLARLFMETANIELGKHVRRFSREAISILLSHDWPGNIRELRSAIRSAVFAADSDVIEAEHLVLDIPNVKESSEYGVENSNLLEKQVGRSLKEIVTHYAKRIERDVLVDALSRTGGDESKAAGLLRIDPETLRSKVLDYGIEPRRSVEDD
jgi:two-component system nitrogen regulation response regulator GlnG